MYKYKFKDEYADYAGLPVASRHDTGVLAHELREVLPDAVTQSHDVTLPNGDVIEDFLVVNKVCLRSFDQHSISLLIELMRCISRMLPS